MKVLKNLLGTFVIGAPSMARPPSMAKLRSGRKARKSGNESIRRKRLTSGGPQDKATTNVAEPTSSMADPLRGISPYGDQHQDFTLNGVSAEWEEPHNGSSGMPTEVEVRIHNDRPPNTKLNGSDQFNNLNPADGTGVVVRAEEVLIVMLVMVLWVGAIALFFNRWGKIRMLEPYQPKFQQQHRQSCPVVDPVPITHPRASFSRGCGSCEYGPNGPYQQFVPYQHFAQCGNHALLRPRQNSVFVGSTNAMTLILESPTRRTRSAADIPQLLEPSAARARLCVPREQSRDSGHTRASELNIPSCSNTSNSNSHLTVTNV